MENFKVKNSRDHLTKRQKYILEEKDKIEKNCPHLNFKLEQFNMNVMDKISVPQRKLIRSLTNQNQQNSNYMSAQKVSQYSNKNVNFNKVLFTEAVENEQIKTETNFVQAPQKMKRNIQRNQFLPSQQVKLIKATSPALQRIHLQNQLENMTLENQKQGKFVYLDFNDEDQSMLRAIKIENNDDYEYDDVKILSKQSQIYKTFMEKEFQIGKHQKFILNKVKEKREKLEQQNKEYFEQENQLKQKEQKLLKKKTQKYQLGVLNQESSIINVQTNKFKDSTSQIDHLTESGVSEINFGFNQNSSKFKLLKNYNIDPTIDQMFDSGIQNRKISEKLNNLLEKNGKNNDKEIMYLGKNQFTLSRKRFLNRKDQSFQMKENQLNKSQQKNLNSEDSFHNLKKQNVSLQLDNYKGKRYKEEPKKAKKESKSQIILQRFDFSQKYETLVRKSKKMTNKSIELNRSFDNIKEKIKAEQNNIFKDFIKYKAPYQIKKKLKQDFDVILNMCNKI